MNEIKTIYSDFDGTITKNDAVNTFFDMYAPKEWLDSEKLWIDGKISSLENAVQQVALLPAISEKVIDDYINSIEIDDFFVEFIRILDKNNINFVILSDGFDLFIEKTLKKYNLNNIKFFANHLIHKKDNKFEIEFPFHNENCDIKAGMCKCKRIPEKNFCYIGDGTSDLCVAQKANVLFATKNLKTFCEKNNMNHYSFKTFYDIYKILLSENAIK